MNSLVLFDLVTRYFRKHQAIIKIQNTRCVRDQSLCQSLEVHVDVPSIKEIHLTQYNQQDNHATACFSGQVPLFFNRIQFLYDVNATFKKNLCRQIKITIKKIIWIVFLSLFLLLAVKIVNKSVSIGLNKWTYLGSVFLLLNIEVSIEYFSQALLLSNQRSGSIVRRQLIQFCLQSLIVNHEDDASNCDYKRSSTYRWCFDSRDAKINFYLMIGQFQ